MMPRMALCTQVYLQMSRVDKAEQQIKVEREDRVQILIEDLGYDKN